MSTRRGRLAAELAERRRCPECKRGAALSTVVHPGQVVTYCRWCDYENATDTHGPAETQ